MNRPDFRRLPKRANPFQAQKQLLDAMHPKIVYTERVQLGEALGRVLAKDAVSNVNIPEHDKTFIDGYAIKAANTKSSSTAKPSTFKITGKLFPADYPTTIEVSNGETVYVACGTPIPKGATATVKVEETRLKDNEIEIIREIQQGEGIIPFGDDMRKGDLLLKKGQVLRPQDIGVLASIGLTEVKVVIKPKVAILSGGDELIRQRDKNPEKIANNYALVVAGLVEELGAQAKILGIMPDALDKVKEKIVAALSGADFVVTIGGSSVGIKDFVPDALEALGKPGVVVQGVLLRPGAISGFGIVDGKPVIMLPGHIGSCIAGFYLFVAPLINRLLALNENGMLPTLNAELGGDLETGPQFRFQLLHLRRIEGKLLAEQVEGGSSALTTIVKSNGFTILQPHIRMAKGDFVEVRLFGKLDLVQIN
jgi:molybdenum cofactor synthesis domain-containing protein